MKFDTRYINRTPRQGPCSGVVAQYKTDSVCALCVFGIFLDSCVLRNMKLGWIGRYGVLDKAMSGKNRTKIYFMKKIFNRILLSQV